MTQTGDEVGSVEMCVREGELAVPRIDDVIRDGWARRRATDSPSAQHDVEGLVTHLLLEEALLQSSTQELRGSVRMRAGRGLASLAVGRRGRYGRAVAGR
jgi:hypothetical protein|uniref:Uncharacterized protein n=1 Tax=Zea mays TaxID=4577 RepID=A0A804LQ21_MAIZE